MEVSLPPPVADPVNSALSDVHAAHGTNLTEVLGETLKTVREEVPIVVHQRLVKAIERTAHLVGLAVESLLDEPDACLVWSLRVPSVIIP